MTREQLIEEIRAAGTDNLGHFGNGYHREGGYSLQQNPEEFADAVLCIQRLVGEGIGLPASLLEIGTASGGTCRFLAEHASFLRIYVMDDGSHPRAKEQTANFAAMKTPPFVFVGDSHSPAAQDWVRYIVRAVDLAFIDGDHSYSGCRRDYDMVRDRARYIMFHDTVACSGVKQVWEEAVASGELRVVLHAVGKERPLGIGIGEVRR